MTTKPSLEVAQIATQAINAYLAHPHRQGSILEGARVDTLEVLEPSLARWLAHLSFPKAPGAFTAHIFAIDAQGRVCREPGYRFSSDELYPAETAIPVASLV